jgi:DNA-binding SARP family transcriptional activator/tetratricopeptide (TPR) repeat protein
MPSSRRSSTEATPLEDRDRVESDVDTADDPSLSFARPNPPSPSTAPDDSGRAQRRPPIEVGPGRPPIVAPILDSKGLLGAMPEYPIQVSKVQAPPLRDQTLARDRLLEWLAVKVHSRAVLVIAEAGYGKTTLLADFSRRTRIRTLWFRLDRGDRDWVGFIAYLVAAVRVHVPGFGAATDSLLRETASSAPPRDTVLDAFLRELGDLPPDPTALVLDDFHLVDDAPDIRHIAIELIARAPERLSFVFASRRTPPVRIARLRALGEVAELGTADLRFDATETEQLFRETYEMRLEPGLIAELSRRTEGWAASLQLVRTALHDRDPVQIRAFIRSLSGAEGHLYDYLAEEVVGDLPDELQQFLMRTSVLETIDLALGPVAAEVSSTAASELIDEGERLGLFGRRGPQTRHQVRAHPLVREFLQARLLRSVGSEGVAEIHRRTARAAEPIDWRLAGHHYLAAGDHEDVRRVLVSSIETVLALGSYAAAEELAESVPGGIPGAAGLILASRIAQQKVDVVRALDLAERAASLDERSRPALLNLITARSLAGDTVGAVAAGRMLEQGTEDVLSQIARSFQRMIETSTDGSLDLAARELESLRGSLAQRGDQHFLGVALLNLSYVQRGAGQVTDARRSAEEAISLLAETSAGIELNSARLALAWALAFEGNLDQARREVHICLERAPAGQMTEVAFEYGEIEALFGEPARAWPYVQDIAERISGVSDTGEQALLARTMLEIRDGDYNSAIRDAGMLSLGEPRAAIAFQTRRILALALLATLRQDPAAPTLSANAVALAARQGAFLWERYARLIEAVSNRELDLSEEVARTGRSDPAILSMAAEPILTRLGDLHHEAAGIVVAEASNRPERWRTSVRRHLATASESHRVALALLLGQIGEREDIKRLRDATRNTKDGQATGLSRVLARRLAPRVFVEDLGRVRIAVGDRWVEGVEVRRKVLALLCLLITKTRFASTREDVLESLWPDLDPAAALNSLNQTVYFLRRVFEADYREEMTPGYVLQDGETIWLDPELLDSRSRRCRELIRSLRATPSPDEVARLAEEYRGRFALDFAYEEWATTYRDSLHASYLRVVEEAIRLDIDGGHFARGTFLAERAAEAEPDAEEIQVALVRLYRLSGAHAAAAEQYGHYAQSLRDLGIEPPTFAEI